MPRARCERALVALALLAACGRGLPEPGPEERAALAAAAAEAPEPSAGCRAGALARARGERGILTVGGEERTYLITRACEQGLTATPPRRKTARMVKLVFLCRRRPDLTHERYVELLLGGHVPLALRHHPALRRYVVNIVEDTRGPAPPLDSIGELWFDTLADYRERLYDSPEGAGIIARDVGGFMGSTAAYVTTEHVQRAPAAPPDLGRRAPGGKLFACLERLPGMTRAAFCAHWLERHVPLALRHHATTRYVTNVVDERLGGGGPDYDGFGELAFASAEHVRGRIYLSPAGQAEIEADIPRFIARVHAYLVAEYVERW